MEGPEGTGSESGCLASGPGLWLAAGAGDFPVNILYLHFFISKMGVMREPAS